MRTTPEKFEAALKFLTTHYTPVRLDDVLAERDGRQLPPRAILLTFDDAYASVVEVAAPLCRKLGVPAIFFVNAAFLDNKCLAPDNLVCYVANTLGMDTVNAAAHAVQEGEGIELRSLSDVFSRFFPALTLAQRKSFLKALARLADVREDQLAEEAALYLTSKDLRALAAFDFEIGNHTFSHVHCRSLSAADLVDEVERNKATLEDLSGTKVRSFSQPYGSSMDLTDELAGHLKNSGHRAVFLSESVANPPAADPFHLERINAHVDNDETFFLELEILPRLRAIRNRIFRRPALSRRNDEFRLEVN